MSIGKRSAGNRGAAESSSGDAPDTAERPRRVLIETYGCQMNVADSELMQGVLQDDGYEVARSLDEADIILLNTCAVREKAEERIFGRLSNFVPLKRERPDLLLGVTGCMAEHLRKSIRERAPYVDLVVGPDAYRRLPRLVEEARYDPVIDVRLDKREVYEGLTPARTEGVCGWITIQRGCDKFCTFCIVPFVRGRERGVPPREVLRKARAMVADGISCVTLLGQTVNSYRYEDVDFADLLRALAGVEGLERIRFTSPYPRDFTPKLIETIASEPKVCKFVHLPVQSASNRVLKAMRRGHTIEEYRELVDRMRSEIPNLALSTDIIVGFPGETESEFQATYDLMTELRYDSAFMFAYSERSGTYAAKKLDDSVPEETKKRRLAAIIEQQQQISSEIYASRIGERVAVLHEGYSKKDPNDAVGNADDFKTTVFPSEGYRPGDIVEVEVESATSHTLIGRPIRLLSSSNVPVDLMDHIEGGISIGAAPPR